MIEYEIPISNEVSIKVRCAPRDTEKENKEACKKILVRIFGDCRGHLVIPKESSWIAKA